MTALEVFRLTAAEFAEVDDETVLQWLDLTAPLVSRRQFGKLYDQALALLAAHRMKMSGAYDSAESDEGGGVNLGSVADSLRIASYSEGSASVSFYNGGASSESGGGDFGLTVYGTQFKALQKMVIIPIHCSGEVT